MNFPWTLRINWGCPVNHSNPCKCLLQDVQVRNVFKMRVSAILVIIIYFLSHFKPTNLAVAFSTVNISTPAISKYFRFHMKRKRNGQMSISLSKTRMIAVDYYYFSTFGQSGISSPALLSHSFVPSSGHS